VQKNGFVGTRILAGEENMCVYRFVKNNLLEVKTMEKNENKTNNKKKGILIVALLLALIIAIFAMAGTTFAKYVTSTSVQTNSATVAKWGYVVSADATDLFSSKYDAKTTNDKTYAEKGDNGVAISSSANVVAPGAKGEMTFSVEGQAEVLSKLTIAVDTTTLSNISLTKAAVGEEGKEGYVAAEDYYPITWTLTKVDTKNTGDDYNWTKTFTKLADVATQLNSESKTIDVGTEINQNYTLSWVWEFDNTSTNKNANLYDTNLGLIADGKTVDGYTANYTVAFNLNITVEQIQTK
jgi:hypothetical protein